jgi:hypothetical protein
VDWPALAVVFAPIIKELMTGGRRQDHGLVDRLDRLEAMLGQRLASQSPPEAAGEVIGLARQLARELKPRGGAIVAGDDEDDDDAGEESGIERGVKYLLDLVGRAVDKRSPAPAAVSPSPAPGGAASPMQELMTGLIGQVRAGIEARQPPEAIASSLLRGIPAMYRPFVRDFLARPLEVRSYLTNAAPDLLEGELAEWTADVIDALNGRLQ